MTKNENNELNQLLSELFLIIGGFIFAETIINQFLLLAVDVLPRWVLPLLAILLIVIAIDLQKQKSLIKAGILPAIYLGGSIFLIVLLETDIIKSILFLILMFILYMIILIIYLIILIQRKRKK